MRLPIASDGWRFIVPLIAGGAILAFVPFWIAKWLGGVLLLAGLFCINFFRDFDRPTPQDVGLLYSPGDGKVVAVDRVQTGIWAGGTVIRIFLSVFDVHVQRVPVSGRVSQITYQKGQFLDARHPEAHIRNEQNAMLIESEKGKVLVVQIAGLIARRILCWVSEGDEVVQGARYGLIRFGSQVDVFLPPNASSAVEPGERVVGGMTVLAKWA